MEKIILRKMIKLMEKNFQPTIIIIKPKYQKQAMSAITKLREEYICCYDLSLVIDKNIKKSFVIKETREVLGDHRRNIKKNKHNIELIVTYIAFILILIGIILKIISIFMR